jgi:hypothetical protein
MATWPHASRIFFPCFHPAPIVLKKSLMNLAVVAVALVAVNAGIALLWNRGATVFEWLLAAAAALACITLARMLHRRRERRYRNSIKDSALW